MTKRCTEPDGLEDLAGVWLRAGEWQIKALESTARTRKRTYSSLTLTFELLAIEYSAQLCDVAEPREPH